MRGATARSRCAEQVRGAGARSRCAEQVRGYCIYLILRYPHTSPTPFFLPPEGVFGGEGEGGGVRSGPGAARLQGQIKDIIIITPRPPCHPEPARTLKHKMIQQEMEFDKVLKFEWPCPSYRLTADCLQTLKDADSMSQMARHQGMS